MERLKLLQQLAIKSTTKMVLLILDGLGGLPMTLKGETELEVAYTPHMDALAQVGTCGLMHPVSPGITPGSGPSHLALFGYDPMLYEVGRGILGALGIGFPLLCQDVACRINFAAKDERGLITDRRAGRIASKRGAELCTLLDKIEIPGVELSVRPIKEHRAVMVLRGKNLSGEIADTDPQTTGAPPHPVRALTPEANHTAQLLEQFLTQANKMLAPHYPVNTILLRGISKYHSFPKMGELYKLRAAAIATYPMYRGVARLAGMDVLSTGETIASEFQTLKEHWEQYDYFFVHIKKTDSYGEDGNFAGKAKVIEEVDSLLPQILELKPDCLAVTGDHSTPAKLKSHSWHPVPVLLYSPSARPDNLAVFSEEECRKGSLGVFPTQELMGLMLAHALRLTKFGA